MIKNFIISGMGGSGTVFLSQQMNKSKIWSVNHENKIDHTLPPLSIVQPRFNQDYYGEVNGCLRAILLNLKVDKKAIILRDLWEIVLSSMNRRNIFEDGTWNKMVNGFEDLDRCLLAGIPIIWFNRMTTDLNYLYHILKFFDINDVPLEELDLNKKNSSTSVKNPMYSSISQIKKRYTDLVNFNSGWFIERYFSNIIPESCVEI